MIQPQNILLLGLLWLFASTASADALMRSKAVDASSLAQYYVDETGVRVELEIGLSALTAFRHLMPESIYREMGYSELSTEERLQRFFGRDLAIFMDGEPLPAYVEAMGPSRRVLRDPINGTPLPVQDEAPDVIRATLVYRFPEGEPPTELAFTSPPNIDIGFVLYHKGVAVNDYRYLASGYQLTLDWEDPWYSSFNAFQLKRRYAAPMSGFIYVENFEVRKEIIVRPKDLQRWLDLGLEGREEIPVELQAEIRQKVGEFLSQHQPVTIDGEPVSGILESVNFLERTLTSSRVIDPPEPLPLDAAIMGAIFVFPRSGLPQEVEMEWDLWDERIQRIPVSAVDQAGPLPSYLEPDWSTLNWTNHLKNPTIPTMYAVQQPVAQWRLWLDRALPLLLILALLCAIWLLRNRSKQQGIAAPAALAALFLGASAAAFQLGANNRPDQARAELIVSDLLHNIYRAFDFREESEIYDALARSVSGDLLTDIYLETKRSLVLANQGGASAKVKEVALEGLQLMPAESQGQFIAEVEWTVHGSVGHWGHIHQRSNRYLAKLGVSIDEGQWKLRDMDVLQEERLQ